MDTPKLVDSLLTAAEYAGILAVMYMVILQYRLPYLLVLLAYIVVRILGAIYNNIIRHRIIAGDNRPMPAYGLVFGIIDIVLLFAALIGVPVMASYRFSALEVGGVFVTGLATSMISNKVLQRM
jgi:hypothetical protein